MQAPEKIPNNASTSLSEYDAITRTVQTYINGGKSGAGRRHEARLPSPMREIWESGSEGFCKLAGIKDLRIQDLRHSATTVLYGRNSGRDDGPNDRAQEQRASEVSTPKPRIQKADSRKIAQKLTGAYWHRGSL